MTMQDVWGRLAVLVGCGATYRPAIPSNELITLMNEIATAEARESGRWQAPSPVPAPRTLAGVPGLPRLIDGFGCPIVMLMDDVREGEVIDPARVATRAGRYANPATCRRHPAEGLCPYGEGYTNLATGFFRPLIPDGCVVDVRPDGSVSVSMIRATPTPGLDAPAAEPLHSWRDRAPLL